MAGRADHGADALYSTVETENGPLDVPNAIKEPGVIQGDFHERIRETLEEDFCFYFMNHGGSGE